MKKYLCLWLFAALLLCLFAPANVACATDVPVGGETTTIELEDFYDAYITENEHASGGKLLYTDWGEVAEDTAEGIVIDISLDVTEEGYYDTSYAASSRKGNEYVSMIQILADETEIGNNDITGTQIADNYMDDSYFIVYRYTGAPVYFTKGTHTLRIFVGITKDERFKFALDYIQFSRRQPTKIGNETALIEFEDYSGKFIAENEHASGSKLVYTSWGTGVSTYSINIPIDVENGGFYTSEFAVAKHPAGIGTSDVVLKIDETEIGNNKSTTAGTDISNGNTYLNETWPMYLYRGNTIYLEKGQHIIKLEVATTGDNVVKFAADYIKLIPVEAVTVPDAGTRFEFEDYANRYITENEYASGGKLLAAEWGTDATYQLNIPFYLAEDGYYMTEFTASQRPNNIATSDLELLIDGVAASDNTAGSGKDISEGGAYVSASLPMHQYVSEIYLDKGAHVFTLNVKKASDSVVKFAADYVSIVKNNADKVLLKGGSAQVIANYETAVNGTAIAAFYAKNRLIGINNGQVSAQNTVAIEAELSDTPDTAKLFIWVPDTMTPAADCKTIETIVDAPTDVYLLGDSVCVEYDGTQFPMQGWGHDLPTLFQENVTVKNKAVGGTSTKTYQTLGFWDAAISEIDRGDYVMLNFGLNDFYNISEDGKGTTIAQYKENLTMFCNKILEKGATPVLVTPLPECKTNTIGALIERSDAMKEVGAALGVTVLDVNAVLMANWLTDDSGAATDEMCDKAFDQYYLSETAFHRLEEEYGKPISDAKWEYIQTTNDRTHLNVDGASYFASTVADLLKKTDLKLASYLK